MVLLGPVTKEKDFCMLASRPTAGLIPAAGGAHGVLEIDRPTQIHKHRRESSTDSACSLTAILSLPLLPSVTARVNWCLLLTAHV